MLKNYLEYHPIPKILVVGEENLLETQNVNATQDNHLIYLLADAIYQIAATRPVDPNWESRPRGIWQQYELKLDRIDKRIDDSLGLLFEKQIAKEKWKGTQAIQSRREYWNYGVMAYFNAVGQSPPPIDSNRSIRTREDLSYYDPDLYQIVNKAMSYDNHVDWRLR